MIYIQFSNSAGMQYSDEINEKLIQIPPKKNVFNLSPINSNPNYFQGYNQIDFEHFNNKLWSLIQMWVAVNCPEFSNKTIKFCTYHLSSHFSLNYVSTYSIIKNIIEINEGSDFTIICTDDILTIDSDWCSDIISLIAAVECFDNHGVKYFLHANSSNILKNLIDNASMNYLPSILLRNNNENRILSFNNSIAKFKYISYQLTNRNNFLRSDVENLNIIPKSNIIENNIIGAYLQFNSIVDLSTEYKEWADTVLLNNHFSNKLMSNFFNSLGLYLLPLLKSSYTNLNNIFPHNDEKYLILEEIVDLEALPIISIFEKYNKDILITQHSNDPITKPLEYPSGIPLAKVVYVNNSHSFERYSKILDVNSISYNPIKNFIVNNSLKTDYRFKPTIIIIENDFFRNFGMPYNIVKLHQDIITFIFNLQIYTSNFNILWRQRSNDYNPIYIDIKSRFTSINFFFDNSLEIQKLKEISNISIGFGTTSSFAFSLVCNGIVNFFGSNKFCDHEYLPNISKFHNEIGPRYCAKEIGNILLNKNEAYNLHLTRQQNFLINY